MSVIVLYVSNTQISEFSHASVVKGVVLDLLWEGGSPLFITSVLYSQLYFLFCLLFMVLMGCAFLVHCSPVLNNCHQRESHVTWFAFSVSTLSRKTRANSNQCSVVLWIDSVLGSAVVAEYFEIIRSYRSFFWGVGGVGVGDSPVFESVALFLF